MINLHDQWLNYRNLGSFEVNPLMLLLEDLLGFVTVIDRV
jgi:hypothetical protein